MPPIELQTRLATPIILVVVIVAFVANVAPSDLNAASRLQCSSGRHSRSSVALHPQSAGNQPEPASLSFCVLVGRPEVYDQRIVRTTAILVAGYEQYFLYSQYCNDQDSFVWAEYPSTTESNTPIQLRSLPEATSVQQRTRRTEVTLLGRFIAPGPKRFGHLDEFRMKFVIMRVERVKAVSKKTVWPIAKTRADSADEIIRFMNREFILHIAGVPSYAVIAAEILADDFRFTDSNGDLKSKSEFLAMSFMPYSGLVRDTEVEVHVRGDSAVARGLVVQSTNDSADNRYRYTVNYRKRGPAWQIVSAEIKLVSVA